MKFRSIPNTELVVSEAGYALACAAPADSIEAERALRLACDEGVNFFWLSGAPKPFDPAFASFAAERRAKIRVALRQKWTGDIVTFSVALAERVRSLGLEWVDVLFLDGLNPADLADGAVADAVHRLRAAGAVTHAGLCSWGEMVDPRLLERNGFSLVSTSLADRLNAPEDRRPAGVVHVDLPEGALRERVSFLWEGTGRTAEQAMAMLALAQPGACAAFPLMSLSDVKAWARAPMAPNFSAEELAAATSALAKAPEPVSA